MSRNFSDLIMQCLAVTFLGKGKGKGLHEGKSGSGLRNCHCQAAESTLAFTQPLDPIDKSLG